MDQCISELLSKKAIRPCQAVPGQFVSDIFLVPKPDGSSRFILNLKHLNSFVVKEHFKLEDSRSVSKLLEKGMFMASLDLKDAYYTIPIHRTHRKFLRFRYNGCLYEFLCLPFGLSSAPYVFTKILKPVASYLRRRGFLSIIYLDDILLLGQSKERCLENVHATLSLLESLGFVINREKSHLVPSCVRTYLGFIFDSDRMSMRLPPEKIENIKLRVQDLLRRSSVKIRDFASLVGYLVSCCPAVNGGWSHTKSCERAKICALRRCEQGYEGSMTLSEEVRSELSWWLNIELLAENPIRSMTFVREIFSDASLTGWGASCGDSRASGFWKESELKHHINYLEISAAFLALKCFASDLRDSQILLRIDNTTAIAHINKGGGTRSASLNRVTRDLWEWCLARGLWVYASYIPSQENSIADFESRRLSGCSDIEISKPVFSSIISKFGLPSIDLFASRDNAKCPRFVSWKQDPDSFAVDAFSLSWSGEFFYAFPPPALLPRVLQKIKQDGASGILVVPEWTGQPWFPIFMDLLSSDFLRFPAKSALIFSNRVQQDFWSSNILVVGILSGKPSGSATFQHQPWTSP